VVLAGCASIAGTRRPFRVVGDDGAPLEVDLNVSHDGRTMLGQGRNRAAFGFRFTRAAGARD
jgi:hypothetical protein